MTESRSAVRDGQATPRSPGALLVDALDRLRRGQEVFFKYLLAADDLVDPSYTSLTLDDPVALAWQRLGAEKAGDIPVAEAPASGVPLYVGSVRRTRICEVLSEFAGSQAQRDDDEKALKTTVSTVVSRGMPTLAPGVPILQGLQALLRSELDNLAIVGSDGEYLGALSTLSVLRCFGRLDTLHRARTSEAARQTRLFDLMSDRGASQPTDVVVSGFLSRAAEVMGTSVPTLGSEDKIEDAVRLFEERRCRHAFVVERGGKLKGLLDVATLQLALPPPSGRGAREPARKDRLLVFDGEAHVARQILAAKIATVVRPVQQVLGPDDTLVRAAELLLLSDAVPVVDGAGAGPKGLITRSDLVRVLIVLGELAAKRGLVTEQDGVRS